MSNIFEYDVEENSKKNAVKLIFVILAATALIVACGYASWWSFQQTVEFLIPGFESEFEPIVFGIIIQYGPQPALFFIGVFSNKWQKSKRALAIWKKVNNNKTPTYAKEMEVWLNLAYMVIAGMFFVGLSAIDYLTNAGQIRMDREAGAARGYEWSTMLWYVMNMFAFFVLWVEEIAGNLFVYLFVMLEDLSKIMGWGGLSFFKSARIAFQKLSGRSEQRQNGSTRQSSYQEPRKQGYVTRTPIVNEDDDEDMFPELRSSEVARRQLFKGIGDE